MFMNVQYKAGTKQTFSMQKFKRRNTFIKKSKLETYLGMFLHLIPSNSTTSLNIINQKVVDIHSMILLWKHNIYHKTSNIRRTLAGNKIVDHSDVVGASPVGAAPTTSSFST